MIQRVISHFYRDAFCVALSACLYAALYLTPVAAQEPPAPPAPAEKPRPFGRPQKPADTPSDKPLEKPQDKPADQPPVDKPPVDKPADKPVEKPQDKPAAPPEKPVETPADKPADKPADVPVKPADTPNDKPEKPADTPTDPAPVNPSENPLALQVGEVLLSGRVVEVNKAGRSLTMLAESFTAPSGKTQSISPPRSKIIVFPTAAPLLVNDRNDKGRFPLGALRRGDDVVALGRDSGSGLPLTVRRVQLRSSIPGLLTARALANFKTKHVDNNFKPSEAAPEVEGYQLVRYPSPAGELAAYLSNDPGDGKPRPAVLWAHGGFGGIGPPTVAQAKPFLDAGCVVMCPSWRGENDNPGQFEMFYGEVEDAVAALGYLSKLPYVDPARIYMAGHSTGGTITLLTAASTPLLRAAFSLGGAPDMGSALRSGGYDNVPFDKRSDDEIRYRSPGQWISFLRAPTFYFEGANSFYVRDAKWMEATADRQSLPLRVFILDRGDHFTIVTPLLKNIAAKIQNDTGPSPNFTFTAPEFKDLFLPTEPTSISK